MIETIIISYMLGYFVAFLLFCYSANWYLDKSVAKPIFLYSLLSWVAVLAMIVVIIVDIGIDD